MSNTWCNCNCPAVLAVFGDESEWGPYCHSLPDRESEGTWRCPWCHSGITRTFVERTGPREASAVVDDDDDVRQDPREGMREIIRLLRERGEATTVELADALVAGAALRDGPSGAVVDDLPDVREISAIVRVGYRCRRRLRMDQLIALGLDQLAQVVRVSEYMRRPVKGDGRPWAAGGLA